MSSKTVKTAVPLLMGLAVFILTLKFVGFGEVLESLGRVNLYYYALAIGAIFFSICMWALRWWEFIRGDSYNVPFTDVLKGLVVGLAINNLTPVAKCGGEPVRAYILKIKNDIKMRDSLATVIAELTVFFIGTVIIVLMSLALITVIMQPPPWILIILVPFFLLVALGLFGIVGIYSDKKIIVRLISWFGRKIKRLRPYQEKLLQRYKDFQETFRRCLKMKDVLLKALLYTFLSKVAVVFKFYILFAALGYSISPLKIIIFMGLSLIILSVPSTPGSLGVYEGGATSVLILMGVPGGIAATVVFLDRLIWFWCITIIGGSLGTYYGVSIINRSNRTEINNR